MKTPSAFARSLVIAVFGILLSGLQTQAATQTWIGTVGSSDWATGANWNTTFPASGDSLVFTSTNFFTSGTLTNTLATTGTIATITFNAGSPAYTMTGNTFRLSTSIINNSGTLQTFQNTGGLGLSATTATFDITGAGITITNGITNLVNGINTITVTGAGNTLTLGGYNLNGFNSTNRINVIGGTGNVNITGAVTSGSSSASGLTYNGSGTLSLTANNTYTGNTTVSSGVLQIGNGGATGSVAGNIVDNGTVIFNRTGSYAYTGAISGSGSVIKIGSGTLTLGGGSASTFTGGLTIDEGTVLLATSRGLGQVTNNVTINNSSILDLGGLTSVSSGTLTLNEGSVVNGSIGPSAIDARSGQITATISSASGQLIKSTSGTVTLSGASGNWGNVGSTGAIIINDGVLVSNNATALGGPSLGSISGTGVVVNSAGRLDMAVAGSTRLLQINGGTITGTSLGVSTSIGAQGGSVSAALTGSATLTKTTSGTLTLSGSNTYSGGTALNDGVLQIGANGTAGSIAGNVVTGSNSAVLAFNRSDAYTFGGTISGSGQVRQIGTGTTTLTANNTYTGTTTINAGTLKAEAASGSALGGTSDITINTGGTLLSGTANQINNTADINLAGGTLNLGGFAEGSAGTNGVGTLTLSLNSIIDFGAGSAGLIQFAGIAHTGGNLSILNWTGTPYVGNTGDRLLFSGLESSFTSLFSQSEVSFNGISGFATVQYDGFYELVAVPEPATVLCGLFLFGFLIWKENKRLKMLMAPRKHHDKSSAKD